MVKPNAALLAIFVAIGWAVGWVIDALVFCCVAVRYGYRLRRGTPAAAEAAPAPNPRL